MTIRLIVNADDFGRTSGVTAGILEAHQGGLVTSTTALMNVPGVEDDLRRAQGECPRLGLGVHLVLTAGRPLTAARSLTGNDGDFPRLEDMVRTLPALDPGELRAEWRAQVERFVAVTGKAPDHLDSHHHVSYLAPPLLRAMLELAREYRCAVRLPTGSQAEEVALDLPAGLVRPLSEWAAPLLGEFAPRHPDHLVTSFYGPTATRPHLLDLLADTPSGSTELMCHPGHADAALLTASSYSRQREQELAVLTDAHVQEAVRRQGILLISFAEL